MARDGSEEDMPRSEIMVLLFCACMRYGEDGMASRRVTWVTGEYDVLSTEEAYAAVANHRRECRLQPDLVAALGVGPE